MAQSASFSLSKFLFSILIFLSILLYIFYNIQIIFPSIEDAVEPGWLKRMSIPVKWPPPVILMWTTFFSNSMTAKLLEYNNITNCKYKCFYTDNKSFEQKAAMLVFHARDEIEPLPKHRTPEQLYTFFVLESPYHTWGMGTDVPEYFFNISMTYRYDSDVQYSYDIILFCYESQLSANLPFTSPSKPNKRFELTRKQNSQLCLKNWENEQEKLKIDKFKDVEWHGFIIFQQGPCLKIQADIFSKNILLYNIQTSDLLNFLFGNNNELKSKIVEASEIDKNLISESKKLQPSLNEFAGILALKMDIMIFKEIKTNRQLFWTYIDRCQNKETKIFKMSVISDMDKASKVNNNTWQSYFIRGILYFSPPNANITWTETIIFLTNTATKKGRAMESNVLSIFLTIFNKQKFVNKDGTVRDKNRMFIKKINSKGEIQHIDWFNNYDKLRNAANCSFPGFLVHEAVQWSNVHKQWVFLPRFFSLIK
ncbi:Glyco_tran_10_N domain-containing protein [Meloidogyne graminicola]|uniref:Glyco_tran_10_N domain-containing protein n=1 Tax=Meloidogyne graminicola TaxID=189291 RepID=A0A8S9ZQQ4_9BILA|nr:Glyco_tran_10_N domain-containing protein [Meloidogyne graminicola]